MLYEKYYGLREKPFQVAPNPKYLYLSSKHLNALTYLEYGISEGDGFVLLTGDIGTGKTLLIKKLLSRIGSNLEVAVIFSTNLDADQLIHLVLNEFEIPGQFHSKAFALDALYQYLVTKFNQNQRVILIIDEVQNLPLDALEEVRMMSNIQSDTQSLIQIVLVGQPEIKKTLATPSLAALTQRISWHYHLGPLSLAETKEYINFRLQVAGRKTKLFTADALNLIHRASGGIPRTINILCENLLVYGFADEARVIERPLVMKVLHDRRAITAPVPPPSLPAPSQGVTASTDAAMTHEEADHLMERIHELEERLNSLPPSPPEVIKQPGDVEYLPYPSSPRRPAERANKWAAAKARVRALQKMDNATPLIRTLDTTRPPEKEPPAPRAPARITGTDPLPAVAPPVHRTSPPATAATPSSAVGGPVYEFQEPEFKIWRPDARLGWLVLTGLLVVFVMWMFSPETGEQPGPPPQAQEAPQEKNTVQASGLPTEPVTVTATAPAPSIDGVAAAKEPPPVNARPAATPPMPLPHVDGTMPPAAIEATPPAEPVSAIPARIEPAGRPADDGLSETALRLRSQFQRDKTIVIQLGDDLNDPQLDTLTILDALAELLHHQPGSQVVLLGYTNPSGSYGGSQKFGGFQADTVKSFLEGKGIQTNRIKTYGLDPTFTVVSNDSENGVRLNQRVEIKIVPLPASEASQQPRP